MIPTLPAAFAALSTFSKCSGILAWVSKLSTTLKCFTYSGVWAGRSVALPPPSTSTSILSLYFSSSDTARAGTPLLTLRLSGFLLVNTATSSISGFCAIALSTPLDRLP